MSATIQDCAFSTYVSAYDHAQLRTRCAHVACGVIINGETAFVATNTPERHAEMEALQRLTSLLKKDVPEEGAFAETSADASEEQVVSENCCLEESSSFQPGVQRYREKGGKERLFGEELLSIYGY